MANTGNKIVLTLKKVVDGGVHDGEALDENNDLCSISGLPQAVKDNEVGDPDYIAPYENFDSCPISALEYAFNSETSGGSNTVIQLLDATDSSVLKTHSYPVDGDTLDTYTSSNDVIIKITNNRGIGSSVDYGIYEGDSGGTLLYSGTIANSVIDGDVFETPALAPNDYYVYLFTT